MLQTVVDHAGLALGRAIHCEMAFLNQSGIIIISTSTDDKPRSIVLLSLLLS